VEVLYECLLRAPAPWGLAHVLVVRPWGTGRLLYLAMPSSFLPSLDLMPWFNDTSIGSLSTGPLTVSPTLTTAFSSMISLHLQLERLDYVELRGNCRIGDVVGLG
jgi:hypothetical protein